jgi:ribosomal protein L37AE/L43A
MNIQPFHMCCQYTQQIVCYCKKNISKEEIDKKTKFSKLIYQLYSQQNPDYVEKFGEAYLITKTKVPGSLIKIVDTDDLDNGITKPTLPTNIVSNTKSKLSTHHFSNFLKPIPSLKPKLIEEKKKIEPVLLKKVYKCSECKNNKQEEILICSTCKKTIHSTCHVPSLAHLKIIHRQGKKKNNKRMEL